MWSWLLIAGCSGPPSWVPDAPGRIDGEPDALTVWNAAAPTVLFEVYDTTQTVLWGAGVCPEVHESGSDVTVESDGCSDGEYTWHGDLQAVGDDTVNANFDDFGATSAAASWTYDGDLSWTLGAGTYLTLDFDLVIQRDDAPRVWLHGPATLTYETSQVRIDAPDLDIGIEGWGTAVLASTGVYDPTLNECTWPFGGTASVSAANDLTWAFPEEVYCNVECPTWTLDGVDQGEFCP